MGLRMMSLGRVVIFCLAASLAAGCGGQRPPEPAKGDTPAPPEREKAGTTASAPEPSLLSPGVHEQTAALPGGGTLRYTISVPGGYDPEEQVPLVVALHDGGEVTPFCGRGMVDGLVGPAFADLGAVIVAPDSLGDDWTTDENEQAVVWLTGS